MGLIIGLAFGRDGGWAYGLFSGVALGLWFQANARVQKLQEELTILSKHFYELSKFVEKYQDVMKSGSTESSSVQQLSQNVEPENIQPENIQPEKIDPVKSVNENLEQAVDTVSTESQTTKASTITDVPPVSAAASVAQSYPAHSRLKQTEPEDPLPLDRAINWLKHFFTTGNVLVKVGVLVLFFGVAFLVKYAAERNVFPIELRLASVGIVGLVLLAIGWRLRLKNTGYALVLQGGALGILYLTVFSALRLYSLLPPTLAFSILFVFAAFSAALAVLQNSRALAVLGMSGGFLAPILTSTGSGSHVALFSYYLVLNLGIFGIAWFRSWRMLNVVGFAFTFVVASAWGFKYYIPEFFISTEPFLIAFYLLYVAIAVLFAFKQPVQLKGYVDSTLVFGVPLVGFGLQAGMVNHIEYALAWSSLSLAALYILLASFLWKRINTNSRLLCEAFLAIGIMFATLAVPFALDAGWTAGVWALEGAAAVWIGSRQSRLLPRLLGYLLQLAGGIAFLISLDNSHYYDTVNYLRNGDELFALNGFYMGAVIVALSGLFVAWRLYCLKSVEATSSRLSFVTANEHLLSVPMLGWGLLWWYAAGLQEIIHKIIPDYVPLAIMLFFSFSVFVTQWCKDKLEWSQLRWPSLILLPVLYLLFPYTILQNSHPFGDWNILGWPLAMLVFYKVLKQYDNESSGSFRLYHIAGFYLIILLVSVEAAWQVDNAVKGAEIWWVLIASLVPLASLILMYHYGHLVRWPVARHRQLYQLDAALPLGLVIWLWFVLLNVFNNGDASPLQYIPLLNPLDILLALQLLGLIYWLRFPLDIEDWGGRRWRFDYTPILLALSMFLWLNTIWLRAAHQLWQVPFEFRHMMHSDLVQAGLSILWGVTGLLCMVYGARKLKAPCVDCRCGCDGRRGGQAVLIRSGEYRHGGAYCFIYIRWPGVSAGGVFCASAAGCCINWMSSVIYKQ